MKRPPLPYTARLLAAFSSGALRRGAVTQLEVRHDAGCPGRRDGNACRCIPEIEFIDGAELVRIGPHGEVERRPTT